MKFGLEQHTIDDIVAILKQYPKIDKATIFGSRAKGNYRPDSDIDIAIKGQDIAYKDVINISVKIDDLNIGLSVDLLNYHTIKEPALKEHIDRVGIEFYSRWKECKLGVLCSKIGSGSTPTGGSQAYKTTGISLIRSQNVLDLKFGYDGLALIDDVQAFALKNVTVQENDILLNITGDSVARVCKVPKEVLPARVNQHVAILRPQKDKLNNQFLLYQLQEKKENLLILSEIGGTRNALTKVMIEDFEISLPPLPEQTAIASILSSLDDKIDLLHRQNKTLEQLAETLFRQWFVEEVEESWEVGTVLDLFKLQRGFDLPSQNRIEGKYPIVASNGISEYHNEYKVKGPGVTTGRSGSLGNVFYIDEDFWPLNTSLYVSEFKRATPLFSYFFLKTLDLNSLNGGSAVPTLNRNNVHEMKTELPPHKLIQDFEDIVKTYFQKIKFNHIQIRTLTQTRDALLPKLMSGEVRVEI